ncbi:MAG: hypothetical protein AAFQ82_21735, partial [Myxococcota bacterium]
MWNVSLRQQSIWNFISAGSLFLASFLALASPVYAQENQEPAGDSQDESTEKDQGEEGEAKSSEKPEASEEAPP